MAKKIGSAKLLGAGYAIAAMIGVFLVFCYFNPLGLGRRSPRLIKSVPYVITKSGNYLLTRNLTFSRSEGAAIEIKADNVSVDLNGFSIETGPSTKGGHAFGIYAIG